MPFQSSFFPVCTSLTALVPLVAFVFEESGHYLRVRCLFRGESLGQLSPPLPLCQDNSSILQNRSVRHHFWPGTAERGSPCCPFSQTLYRTEPGLSWKASAGTSCTCCHSEGRGQHRMQRFKTHYRQIQTYISIWCYWWSVQFISLC